MKTEEEWLKCFKANLESDIDKIDSEERKKIIFWELSWVNDRLGQIQLNKSR